MKTHNPIILVTLACLLMLTSACGKKSVRGVSGMEDPSANRSNHEVTGHDKDLYGDSLAQRGETPLEDGGDTLADGQGATMGAGGEQGLTNDGSFPGDPSVQFEESSLADGSDDGAVEALSASDLNDEKGGAGVDGEGQAGSSSIFSASTRSGVSGSSGGALGMENNNGASGVLTKGRLGATGSSFGASAADETARRNDAQFSKALRDVFFAYNSWRLSEQSHWILESNAKWLKAHPHARISIEGHCDERGTQAYNYVLGERRAETAKQYLSHLGVPSYQMVVVSYGKDRPVCHVFSAACFRSNRRAHFDIDVNTASHD